MSTVSAASRGAKPTSSIAAVQGAHALAAIGSSSSASLTLASIDDRLSALLKSPDFTVASYINLALSDVSPADGCVEHGDVGDVDDLAQRRMAELALRLQVATQGCHDEIGRIGAELRAILPRCAADVGRLGVGLGGMRDDAAALLALQTGDERNVDGGGRGESEGGARMGRGARGERGVLDEEGEHGDEDGGAEAGVGERKKAAGGRSPSSSPSGPPPSSLETLATLHALRSNLSLARSILSAASSWDETLSSVPSLLSSQNLSDAVSALSRLESGERALRGMPGRSDRQSAIAKIRGQVEVMLRPQLLHALQRMDTRIGPLQKVAALYARLGKVDGLAEEYVKQRPGEVHRAWFDWASSSSSFSSGRKGRAGGETTTTTTTTTTRDGTERGRKSAPDELKFLGENDEGKNDDEAQRDEEEAKTPAASAMNPVAFVEWLPEWYERVLSLLSEERRRSAAVFGTDMAPEVIARVLMECFRPILPSFKTRLSAIHPPSGDTGVGEGGNRHNDSSFASGAGAGSFESICAAYESTLQFLSLAYDHMVGFDAPSRRHAQSSSLPLDVANDPGASSLSSTAKSPAETYQLVRASFVSVASPFAPYQENFATLERKHTALTARIVARDVQGAVSARFAPSSSSSSSSRSSMPPLSWLQDAAERLGDLSPYLFPTAEGSVARFELLNCGYRASYALGVIDGLLAGHVGEIAIAVGTLTASVTSDEDGLADAFDEQHVQCALEVLRVAGTFRKDLRSFEAKARERMGVLYGRMREAVEREGPRAAARAVPDSLSAVEMEAMLARAVCGAGDEAAGTAEDRADDSSFAVGANAGAATSSIDTPSLSALRRLASSTADGALLPDAFEGAMRLAAGCHVFVFDICSAVPRRALRPMSSLHVWREEGGTHTGTGIAPAADDSYGVLPQQYITQVGEHMLALVQALEPFASDPDALACATEAMAGAKKVAVQPWRELFASIGGGVDGGDGEDMVVELMNGKGLAGHLLVDSEHNVEVAEEEEEEEEVDDETDKAVAAFCNEWLDVVGSAITGRLLERVMMIRRLGKKGCEHLAVDLNYIVNVFSALGVSGHPHPLLGHFAELVQMSGDELMEKISARDAGSSHKVVGVVRAAEVRIALMRGVSIP